MAGRPRNFEPEQVLQKAMFVFWEKGYDGTGIADLEQATGLGRQSLYGAFGDKQALFLCIVDFYFDNVLKRGLVDVLDSPGSALSNLERVFASWEALGVSPDFNGCLVGKAVADIRAHDAQMVDVLRRKLRLLEDAFARALRRAIRDGEVRSDLDPSATARGLLTIAQGLAVIARVRNDPAFVRGVVDSARRLLV